MKLKLYQVDAFTDKLFSGNPAAVCPLTEWLDDEILQNIALENNLSETAFFVPTKSGFHIRWMTPTVEVPLCGHATLASSFVIFNILKPELNKIEFDSLSGKLYVEKENDLIKLNFPANVPETVEPPQKLLDIIKVKPTEVLFNESYVLVFEKEEDVFSVQPNFNDLAEVNSHTVIITAPGNNSDFVSRVFAPEAGINEDPVTGYAHTLLIPYWSKRLNKNELHAYQVSKRGGELFLKNLDDRVEIAGKAVLYFEGEIEI